MIERSEAANYAKSRFYEQFQDVDVYVEDTARESKKVYVELLSRVFGNKLSVQQVFPLGSKSTVVKRCRADQDYRDRPAVYIVDGDYDILLGKPPEPLLRYYRLRRYCVENYLLEGEALIDVLCDESTDHDEGQVRRLLDYDSWCERVAARLTTLVAVLAAATKKQCGLPTVKIDLADIQGDQWDHVCESKVEALRDRYRVAMDEAFGEGTFDDLFRTMQVAAASPEDAFIRFLSAKSILLPMLRSRIKRRLGLEVNYPQLRVKLARRCDVSELLDLPAAVS